MPEWPEVGVVSESLKKRIVGKKISKVEVLWNNIIATPLEEFKNNIINQRINDVTRLGKYIIVMLDDYGLVIHLRMEGKFFYRQAREPVNKHEHVIVTLDDFELRYQDTRKFGKMYLIKKEDLYKTKPLSLLGLEPFDDNLTSNYLKDKLKNKNIPIKTALLDQNIMTGIGNIYADEILFLAKVNPLTKANNVEDATLNDIVINTRIVFKKALAMGGTTIKSYTSEEGVHGRFQQELLVHTKAKLPCPVCGTEIVKIRVGGRGTDYCPNCQKEK